MKEELHPLCLSLFVWCQACLERNIIRSVCRAEYLERAFIS